MRQAKTSGLFGGGGLGFTIGSKSEKATTNDKALDQVGSTIGSINGNVSIAAGNQVTSAGTTFITGKDLNITGKGVTIDNTINTVDMQSKYELKQSGLSVSLGSATITAATSAAGNIKRSSQVEDERLKALYDYKAIQDMKALNKDLGGGLSNGVSVSVSIGSSQTTTEQISHTETVNTSNINAGGNVNIIAIEGDLNLQGTKINATDITLDSKKNITINGADNKQQITSNTSSSSWSVGGTIGTGFFGNSSSGSGKQNGYATTNIGSVIKASDILTIKSGNDTGITGSQVVGDKVIAKIGGNLNIVSKQDTDDYTEKNQNSGFGVSTGQIDKKSIGGVTGSIGQGKTNSTYASVTDQAGIFAGNGGFDITVGKNTDLKGAVIASEATPDKNKISTETLTYSDIQNKADYSASSSGVALNTKPDAKLNEKGVTPNIGVTASGDANSTTKSAIAPGTIMITGNQTQDISKLSRDPSGSLNALGKIFDKETVAEQQELANLFGQEAFKAVGDIAEKNGWKEGSPEKTALHALVGGIMSDLGGSGFTSGAVGAGVSQAVQGELAKITDPGLRLIASSIVGATASKIVGGNAQTGASTAVSGTKNNDYNHRTHREGEIVHTANGFFKVIDGVDTAIAPPPEGVYFWEQDGNNSDYGWDYKKGDGGVTTNDTYFSGVVKNQKFVEINGQAIGFTSIDYTPAEKHEIAVEAAKVWGQAELAALTGGGMVGNVTAAGTLVEVGTVAKIAQEAKVVDEAITVVKETEDNGKGILDQTREILTSERGSVKISGESNVVSADSTVVATTGENIGNVAKVTTETEVPAVITTTTETVAKTTSAVEGTAIKESVAKVVGEEITVVNGETSAGTNTASKTVETETTITQGSSKARYGERKISDETYNKLRKKTPTEEMRDRVNEGVEIPMSDPVLPGKTITTRLEADHIVSMDKITRMDGFERLTYEQQLEVLNNPENFAGLSKTANTSKGSKTFEEWTTYKKENITVEPAFRERMIEKSAEIEGELQKQIDDLVKTNGNL